MSDVAIELHAHGTIQLPRGERDEGRPRVALRLLAAEAAAHAR